MRCPNWLYNWIDRRGRIPWIVRKLWPTAHWCPEMDSLLIIENIGDCFCGHCKSITNEWRVPRSSTRSIIHERCAPC